MKAKLKWLTSPSLVPGKFVLHEKRWVYLDPLFNVQLSHMLSEDQKKQVIGGTLQLQRLYLANQVVGYHINLAPLVRTRLKTLGPCLRTLTRIEDEKYKVLYTDQLLVIIGNKTAKSAVIIPNLSEVVKL